MLRAGARSCRLSVPRLFPAAHCGRERRPATSLHRLDPRDSPGTVRAMSTAPGGDGAPRVWDGAGLTQDDFMKKDECIVVDPEDNIVGHDSKYTCHRFEGAQPYGRLHRAFSVFLFDAQGRLLLQQRATDKITFPGVWTNTCCSHPLYGYEPSEVDTPGDILSGTVPGAKRAAVRKLGHELGIDPAQIPVDGFAYMTRLHYCAADDGGNASTPAASPWGEHEMDYILLTRATVDVRANPEEVNDTKYVTREELKAMMDPSSGLRWSPWFRIIAERFLPAWWDRLDDCLSGKASDLIDYDGIHRIMVEDAALRAAAASEPARAR